MKQLFIKTISFIFRIIPLPERVRDLFMWPLATRVLGPDYGAPMTLRSGFTLNAYLEDQLGRLALFYGKRLLYFWEPSTTQLLEKLVPQSTHIVVAGAHIGLTVLYARKAMGGGGTVHTFEPIPHLYQIAKKNLERNHALGDMKISKMAIGDAPGTVMMTRDRIRSRIVTPETNYKKLDTEMVPITTLDAYCTEQHIDKLDVIFLDIEGYELNALEGAEGMLTKAPPRDIIYEISLPYKDDLKAARALEAYLGQFGYRFYIIDEAYDPTYYAAAIHPVALIPTSPEVYETHRSLRYFNVFATLRDDASVASLGTVRAMPRA